MDLFSYNITTTDSGTLIQLDCAFSKLQRTIELYKLELNEESASRKVPHKWTMAKIEFAIRWMLSFFCDENRRFRKVCIRLSEGLSLCYNENNVGEFFKALYDAKETAYLIKKFNLKICKVISKMKFRFEKPEVFEWELTTDNQKRWMNTLEASLQAYIWFIPLGIMNMEEYFSISNASKLFVGITNFLKSFSTLQLSKYVYLRELVKTI